MSEAKEKDRILAQIKAFKPHNEIEGLNKHIDELVKDGYVSGSFATDGSIIVVRITPKGKRFLENGGYVAARRKSIFPPTWHKALRKDLWSLILAILAAVIATYLSKRLGWM